jgi:hypothetical protein
MYRTIEIRDKLREEEVMFDHQTPLLSFANYINEIFDEINLFQILIFSNFHRSRKQL